MKVQKLQSNQQTFGTKVQIDAHAARMFSLTRARSKILREISQLENNGIDDILTLSRVLKEKTYIKASVLKKEGEKCFVSFPESAPFVYTNKYNKNKYVSIKQLYEKTKKTLNEVVFNKKEFQKFLKYIG